MARLEQAVEAYHSALEERTRELVPLDWAKAQNNLGTALLRLHAALAERARERVPLDWAMAQNNLGTSTIYDIINAADAA